MSVDVRVLRRPVRRAGYLFLALLFAAFVAGCSSDDPSPSGSDNATAAHSGAGSHRGGDKAVPVSVEAARRGDIASYYKATASLEAEKTAEILARVTGVVGSLAAEEGDVVEIGAALLTVANDEYRLKVEQAVARTANLQSRFDRLQAMAAEELATVEELETARSDLASAKADEGLARLNLSYTTVRAPFAGRVTGRLVDMGRNLSVGTPLFVMSDFTPLLARVHVPSREFNQLQHDQGVDLVLDSDATRLRGRVKLISPVIDPTSGTIKVTVEVVDYPEGTRPGDFAEVQIVTARRVGTTLVPRGAVVTEKGESVVFVAAIAADAPDAPTAERRVVEIGFADDERIEIVSGLSAGELVVVRGQRSLKNGALLKIMSDGDPKAGA